MPRRTPFSILPAPFSAPAMRPLALAVLFSLGSGGFILAQAWLLSQVIARVFLGGQDLAGVTPQIVWLVGVIALRALLIFGSEVSARYAAIRVKSKVRMALAGVLLAASPARTAQERTGELVATASEGVEALDAYYSQYLPQLALAALLPILLLAAVFPVDRLTGVILLVTAPLIPIFMALIGTMSASVTRRQWQVLSRLSAHFLDSLQGLTTLKQLNRSQSQVRAVDKVSQEYRQATLSVLRVTFISAFALELIATLSTAIIAVEISLRLLGGGIPFAQALFLLVLAPDFYLPLRTLGARFHAGAAGVTAARRITEVLNLPLPPPPAFSAAVPAQPWTVRFDDVSYTYPGASEPALDGVSFEIPPGEQTALVGESGAGKSTILRLLLGFIRPTSGRIWIGEMPLEAIAIEEWRRQLAWVPQEAYIFSGTLETNLRMANPTAGDETVQTVLERAALLAALAGFPDGLKTATGEGGARLSGGERQRLGIARALLKDAPLLLLDEPTASLDPELEEQLAVSIQELARGRTVLTIAHRLPSVARADRILVIERGKVVQSGEPAALRAVDGPFRQLVQAGGAGSQ